MYPKKLNDKHLEKTEDRNWTYCTPSNLWKPSRWMANELGGYRITFTSLFQNQVEKGRIGKSETLTIRAASVKLLRQSIEATFPSATFSNFVQDDLKANFARQVQQEKAQKQAIADAKQFVAEKTEAHEMLASEMSPADVDRYFDYNVHEFTANSEFSSPAWVAKFKSLPPNLMSFPDGTWQNKKTLQAFCNERGWLIPLAGQLNEAFQFLFSNSHLFLQDSYKRSEKYLRDAVRPFSRDMVVTHKPVSEEIIREAVRRLSAKFGAPFSVSVERLEAVGIPNAQEVFDALQAKYNPKVQGVENFSAKELKEGLNRMRPPVDPADRRKGY